MESSRVAAGRGPRSLPRAGWRADLSAALKVVAGQPRLWLLGTLGFALRGGILILIVPIIVLPTQVEVRFMLGDYLGTSGLTSGFFLVAGAAGALAAFMALLGLLVVAMVEVTSFEQLVTAPQLLEQRAWREPDELIGAAWWRLVRRAYAVQVTALMTLMIAALPVVVTINQAIIDELLRPTSGASIYQRVLFDVRIPLLLFAAAIVLVEILSAAGERELLLRAVGLRTGAPAAGGVAALLALLGDVLARPLRSPLRTLLAATAGWLMWVVAVPVVVGALAFAWQQVEATFLALPLAGVPQPVHLLALFLVAVLLAGAFVVGLVVFGIVSALRAAVWTVAGLR